ncbi:hypothetical protein OX284_014545 [Flavobacterium sp. SUN046]|uniref:hypothetical protein n=1 Tax=Flavobacterium sp. SUN046 TaxID=3002440 RepID=UPI002DB64DE2|nr:hypothetical protein [Flavobacterium sp. SUN046]MEC4050655.1 hypothetical protein [Flavobacterium sp. SUN046]
MVFEYSLLPLDVKEVVDYTLKENLKANPVLRLKRIMKKTLEPEYSDLWSYTWSDIISLRASITDENLYDVLNIVYGISENDFATLDLFNAYAAYKWVVEQFKEIVELEIEKLSSDHSELEIESGAEDLQDFGYYVALDGLTKGDLDKNDSYLMKPYSMIFRKLCLDKKRYEITKTINENASRSIQNNS